MLQNNPLTGLLFLLALFHNSIIMASAALLGTLTGTVTSMLLKYEQRDIRAGLYGYNSALVGLGLVFYYKATPLLFMLIIIASILATLLMKVMYTRHLVPLTSPFVVVTWIFIFILKETQVIISNAPALPGIQALRIIPAVSNGFSQVMFQQNIITGIIFLIAILISSRNAAAFALGGALVAIILSTLINFPVKLINDGLISYNAVLCGIACSGIKFSSVIYTFFTIVLSIVIMYILYCLGLVALTAPFILAIWLSLLVKAVIKK